MDNYKITYKSGSSILWLRFFLLLLGGIQFLSFGISLINDHTNWFNYFELLTGFVAVIVAIYRYEEYFFPYPEITLSDDGIAVSHKGREHNYSWELIKQIGIDNRNITLTLKNGQIKDFNIQYLNYGDIQTAKEQLRKRCESRDILFQSTY